MVSGNPEQIWSVRTCLYVVAVGLSSIRLVKTTFSPSEDGISHDSSSSAKFDDVRDPPAMLSLIPAAFRPHPNLRRQNNCISSQTNLRQRRGTRLSQNLYHHSSQPSFPVLQSSGFSSFSSADLSPSLIDSTWMRECHCQHNGYSLPPSRTCFPSMWECSNVED